MEKWVVVKKGYLGDLNSCLGIANKLSPTPTKIVYNQDIEAAGGVAEYIKQIAAQKGTVTLDRSIYPDVLLACNYDSTSYAVQLKKASKGKTFLVNLRDPVSDHSSFDLIVNPTHVPHLTGQNVIHVTGIAHKVTSAAIEAEAQSFWSRKLFEQGESRLKIAVLVGGSSEPSSTETGGGILEVNCTKEFGRQIFELANRHNAIIMATNLHRTPPEAWQAFCAEVAPLASYLHDFRNNSLTGNPYLAMMGLADVVVTTADSMSMCCEAASYTKPHYIGGQNFKSVRTDHARLAEELIAKGHSLPLESFSTKHPAHRTPLQNVDIIVENANKALAQKAVTAKSKH